MIDLLIYLVSIFVVWNIVASLLIFTKRWTAKDKQDVINCKWDKE
jgi:hypothetical protein|tara:strand:- start:359 stop:493 length:135 start_codon:yes stop_codon:yes gene_type:complete